MKLEVLVATMKQKDYSLLQKMNIQTDTIVCNQCDEYKYDELEFNGKKVKWFSFKERGVGLNRNNALMRAEGDIVLFADDDICYVDGYEKIILDFYKKYPDADIVIFNMAIKKNDNTVSYTVKKTKRVNKYSITSYGAPCITARKDSIRFDNVFFHLEFGGGTKYSCGEDTLFLQECARKGFKIYTSIDCIGMITQGVSTWFCGYNQKYFMDKGVAYYKIDKRLCRLFALYHCFKHRKRYEQCGWKNAYLMMKKGISNVSKNR